MQVWNLHLVTRLHRFTLNPDASFLIWRKDILVVAPLFTGVVQVGGMLYLLHHMNWNWNTSYHNHHHQQQHQVFDTVSSSYKEREPLIGALR